MKAPITCGITLPPYQTMGMYDYGFVMKVTRQISEPLYEELKNKSLPEGYEAFSYKGRLYVGWRQFYSWEGGYYPLHPDVQAAALRAHKSIMYKILTFKCDTLLNMIEQYK